jgi:UPF0755 protein
LPHNPQTPGTGETTPTDAGREAPGEFDPFEAIFAEGDAVDPTAGDAQASESSETPRPPARNRQPMTRREAREAREAQAGSAAEPGRESAPAPVEAGPAEAAPVEAPVLADPPAEEHIPFSTFEELTAGPANVEPATGSPLAWRQQHYLSHAEPKKKKRGLKPLWVTLIIVAIFGGLAGGAYAVFQPQVTKLVNAITPKDIDYKGNGTGEVLFAIKSGDTGSAVATNLQKAGVTKTYEAFYSLLLRQHPEVQFQPGAFKLAKGMSAQAALIALQDPANKVQNTAVIPEGTAEKDIIPILATATKLPVADLQAAAANPAEYGVPAEAKTLEGFLFPATYTFTPGVTAHDAIKTLVDRSFQALDQAGVAPADRWKTVVLASIVQREAGLAPDYPKVSRVFLNRLDQGWKLQSDATVAYGTGNTHTVTTTDAERADAGNPYNTYVHPGLPVGPISNPGDLAINAALHPADGPWMFFVTWNLQTGETIFSTTAAEHDAAVAKWQQWMRDNPNYG